MIGYLADRREPSLFTQKRNRVIGEDLIHAEGVGADNRIASDHHRLVAVADVIRVEPPLMVTGRANYQHRLLELDDADDDSLDVEHETIILMEDGASRQRGREFKSLIRLSPGPRPQAFFPSQCHAVAREARRGI